jgi:agmatinase
MKFFKSDKNFLGIEESELFEYQTARFVIQSVPYEHTSSYLAGSAKGPKAILDASKFVEFYDEELDLESYKQGGICTLKPIKFEDKVDAEAVDLIEKHTTEHLNNGKFVISLGAEHTVSAGFVKAFSKKYENLTVLQIDAHSDLRQAYQNNPYSHASVMARVNELGLNICQIGIRALCKEEAELIKSSKNIHTFYAHQIRSTPDWAEKALSTLTNNVYITIDADGFDPSVIPAVGTAEPNGLFWHETLQFLKEVFKKFNVVGFDVVECAPVKENILSEFCLAKLVYKCIGYKITGIN